MYETEQLIAYGISAMAVGFMMGGVIMVTTWVYQMIKAGLKAVAQ